MNIFDQINPAYLIKTSCPFCGSQETEQFRELADIVKCLNCGAVYLRTRLNDNALRILYQKYAEEGSHMDPPDTEEAIINSPLGRNYFLEEILTHTNASGRLLDIGCGWGAFIYNAKKRGFDVSGIELTEKTVMFGREKLGLDIRNTIFTETELPENEFQVVTTLHTLEHLSKPKETIDKVFRILKPGGLFAGIVPNISSFTSAILRDKWEWIDPFHHLTHFYPEFLKRVLEETGFRILNIYTDSGDFNRAVLRETVKKEFGFISETDIKNKIAELNKTGKGEEIRFFALKRDKEIKPFKVSAAGSSDIYRDFRKIGITLKTGDNYEEIIYKALRSVAEPVHLIIHDPENILPAYADNWNGVTVVRKRKETVQSFNKSEEQKEDEKLVVKKEKEITMDSMNRLHFEDKLTGGFSVRKATGHLPDPLPVPLNLNLGCGRDIRNGFVNIDLYSDAPEVVGMDIRRLALQDNSADMILASDILEHFSHRETDAVLLEWARVLKPGGEIIIRCPSLKLQVNAYLRGDWNADIASYMIFGGQTNPGDYHCVAFDEVTIKKHLTATGFEVISILEEDIPQSRGLINLNMTVRAKKISTVKQSTVDKTGSNLKVVQDTTKTEKQVPYAEKPSVSGGAFEGLDFSEPTTAPEEKPVHENQQKAADHKTSRLQPPYLNIVWEGSQFVYHSLALINREHCSNIIDTGLAELTIVPYEKDTVDPAINPKYKKLAGHDIRIKPAVPEDVSKLPYVWIRHQWPPKSEPPKGAKWIIMQPWEFTALRKDFAELFSQADEIWTPSTFSRSSFINSGIDFNKVQVIPNGIDPDLFKPEGPVYNLKTQKRFKILFVGGTIYRKGIDILLKAYLKVFKREDNVCLVIKDMGGESFYRGQNAKDYINKLQNDPAAPEIIYIDEYLDEEQMAGLYRACDVFACTYRGEGFSLPTLESMACGLPVIVTKGGATDDFVTDEFGWFIPAEKKSIGDMLDDKPLTGEALLLEPDLNETAQILRSIYSDPADIIFRGIAASYTARTMWTWKRASIKMLSRLDYLYGLHMAAEAEKTLTDSRDGSIILYEGESDFNAGDFDSAVLKYKKAIETGSLSAKYRAHTLLKLAYIYTLNEQFDLADKYLIEAAILMPGNPDVIYIRASLLSAKGDWIEMLETITPLLENWAAVKYDSTLGYGLDGLLCVTGDGLLETGDPEASLKVFTEALKYNNNNPYACYGAARCFITADALKEAKDMLEWALKIKPDFTEARDELTKLNDLI